MASGSGNESQEQRLEREAKAKADHDAREDVLPPLPFRPLGEQNFIQYMQFMQETQNKFMAELMGDRKSTRLNSSHSGESRMPSSA